MTTANDRRRTTNRSSQERRRPLTRMAGAAAVLMAATALIACKKSGTGGCSVCTACIVNNDPEHVYAELPLEEGWRIQGMTLVGDGYSSGVEGVPERGAAGRTGYILRQPRSPDTTRLELWIDQVDGRGNVVKEVKPVSKCSPPK